MVVYPLLIWLLLCLLAGVVLACVGLLFINSDSQKADMLESFDCGIDPLFSCRVSFTLHFFLIAVLFVVFDAEILLALPLVFTPLSSAYWWTWGLFLALLFVGLVVEFFIGTVDWKE